MLRQLNDSTARQRVNLHSRPEAMYRLNVATREFFMGFAGVIERAMKFDVMQPNSVLLCDSLQAADLLEQEQFEFGGFDSERATPEVGPAPSTGMRAQAHAEFFAKPHAPGHRRHITGVSTASDVRRCNPTHERARALLRFAFAQVTIQIEFH